MAVKVIKKNCIGCGLCVQTCPFEALQLVEGIVEVDPDKCTNCGDCVEVCPASALELNEPPEKMSDNEVKEVEKREKIVKKIKRELEDYRGVWVFIEQFRGEIAPVSFELLGEGRKLADNLQTKLCGVLLGSGVEKLAEQALWYGADKVYLMDDPVLKDYRTETYAAGLVRLSQKYKPEIILMGATTMGRDLSGAVATELETGLTADCTELSIDESSGYLFQTRPAFGGNIMATIVCRHHRPQMATVRPRVMAMPEKDTGRTGEVVKENLGITEENVLVKVVDVIKEKKAATYLDKAEIIVAGGKGVGNKENFKLLKELADLLGGTIGASRAAVEAGWIGQEYQVGQTGVTVRPKVYFAFGISGAIQHLVGMQTSDVIVAVNTDPDAPIFKVATYGIVGDLLQVVPAMTKAFKEKMGV